MANIDKAADDASVIDVEPETSGSRPLLPPGDLGRPRASTYLLLPIVFLTVTLLGGLRLDAADNAFIFVRPALICLVLAAFMMVLIFRAGAVTLEGWLSDGQDGLEKSANASILVTLFSATVQVLNSLLPERGLPFWIVGFCFLWTLWNNLFAEFETKRMLHSFAALFFLAFVTKYLVLANLTATPEGGWFQRVIENPGKEAFTWLLDLPRYSNGTGYIQFFTLVLYLIGLYLTPRSTRT
jgi:hypothetical protein